jgi:PTH1 family peptidyl-tRNA hydrolase
MKLIIGLGNPGSQYELTRHNAGFRVVDRLAAQQGWTWERRGRAMLANGNIGSEKVVLIKPLTYMNNSGEVVGELVRWYKVQPEDILVVYDELDLPVGKIRLQSHRSAGGHNGLGSVIQHLHTNQFPRLRIGIGRPSNNHIETTDYVLGVPGGDERIELATGEDRALEAIPLIIRQGIATTMNLINADPEAQKKAEEKRRLQQERREQERLRRQAEKREQENSEDEESPSPLQT